jgi:hypothetical protein
MTKPMAAIVTWVENRSLSNLAMIFYWCSMAITFICEIAAITILATISTNNIQDESESWMAVWFFAVDGGIVWIVAQQCFDSVRRDEAIAVHQLSVLRQYQDRRDGTLRLSDVKAMFR